MSPEKEFLSLEEVADTLGVTYQLIYKLARGGEIPAIRVGKLYRISRKELDAYLERSRHSVGGVCGSCGKTYQSRLSLAQKCSAEECETPVCVDCWERKKERYCAKHKPPEPKRAGKKG